MVDARVILHTRFMNLACMDLAGNKGTGTTIDVSLKFLSSGLQPKSTPVHSVTAAREKMSAPPMKQTGGLLTAAGEPQLRSPAVTQNLVTKLTRSPGPDASLQILLCQRPATTQQTLRCPQQTCKICVAPVHQNPTTHSGSSLARGTHNERNHHWTHLQSGRVRHWALKVRALGRSEHNEGLVSVTTSSRCRGEVKSRGSHRAIVIRKGGGSAGNFVSDHSEQGVWV